MAYREFVNIQITFHNGTKFINLGIETNIFVENTLKDLRNNFDRILDKGFEIIRNSWYS